MSRGRRPSAPSGARRSGGGPRPVAPKAPSARTPQQRQGAAGGPGAPARKDTNRPGAAPAAGPARPRKPTVAPDDRAGVARMLAQAIALRAKAGLPANDAPQTTAYRLVADRDDGLPGLIIDLWGPCAVARLRTEAWFESEVRMLLRDALIEAGATSLHWIIDEPSKDRARAFAEAEAGMNAALQEQGIGAPESLVVWENGVQFQIRPRDGFSQGLFTDMRAVRADLARRWAGRRVLNLFSYTCGFGVALARAGAQVTNVDVSARYLQWGRENYALNGLDAPDDAFVVADAFGYLEECVQDGRRFDAIVCDPPAFSQGKSGRSRQFSVRRDLGTLVENTLACLVPHGEALIATNLTKLAPDAFRRLMLGIANERGWTVGQSWAPGADYPVAAADYHLKTALLVPMHPRTAPAGPGRR